MNFITICDIGEWSIEARKKAPINLHYISLSHIDCNMQYPLSQGQISWEKMKISI
jgi:hypothetical protein